MPDGDRFERKLRGKGWRNVYRLGCSGAPIEAVVDRIMRATAHLFRNEPIQCVRELYGELDRAVSVLNNGLFRAEISPQLFDQLSSTSEAIVADEGHSELSRVAQRAALRTFNEIEQSRQGSSDDTRKQLFTRNLVSELSERRCLSAVRDGIMESSGRDRERQMQWEAGIRKSLLEPCRGLSGSLLGDNDSRSIRAPRRLFKPKATTLETLNEPLVRG